MQNAVKLEAAQQVQPFQIDSRRYAKCIEVSRRIRWEIDRDVIRGRTFDYSQKFLPDGLSKAQELSFLSADEQRLVSQIQDAPTAPCSGWSSASSARRSSK